MSKTGKLYPIEKVVKKRTRNGMVEYFVKWKGYSTKSNEWIAESSVKELPKKERATKKTTTRGVRQSTTNRISKASSKANPRTTKNSSSKLALIASLTATSSQARIPRKTKGSTTEPVSVAQTTQTTAKKNRSQANPRTKKSERFYEIERILAKRIVDSKVEYLVHWKGYSRDESSWEPEGPLKSDYCRMYCHSLRNAFLD